LAAFYHDVFGLTLQMDMGWITILSSGTDSAPSLQLASEGGSGTDLPAISIEVDDLLATLDRLQAAGLHPSYGPTQEPWGITRFFFRDPAGNLVNVASHTS
jgi:catechol 2,3-dioxygenase-like lactoylglutathione lyase family enzyme